MEVINRALVEASSESTIMSERKTDSICVPRLLCAAILSSVPVCAFAANTDAPPGRYESHQVETRNENFLSITASGTPSAANQTATSGTFSKAEAEVGYLNGPIDRQTNMADDTRLDYRQNLDLGTNAPC
jgi:hypothetical protein